MFGRSYEHRSKPLASKLEFLGRLARSGMMAALIVVGGLAIGVAGYRWFEGLGWVDALLEASMLLGGMGPCHPPEQTGGKLFASFYALFSGIVFLTMASILVAPVYHRLLHHFHWRGDMADPS